MKNWKLIQKASSSSVKLQCFITRTVKLKKSVVMWPVKAKNDMWSNEPVMLIQHKILKKQGDDKNYQSFKNVKSRYDDLNSQSTMIKCSDKKCQENNHIQSVTKKMDVQLKKPAAKHKNHQTTMSHKKQKKCEYKDSKSQSTVKYVCSYKNCQENIRPKKPRSHMWSVTNNTDVWLPKPAVPYEYRRLCSDMNCQSTRWYRSPMRPMYDKNCQSANMMWSESEGTMLLPVSFVDSNEKQMLCGQENWLSIDCT